MTTEVSRRGVLAGLGGIVAGSALAGCGGGSTPAATDPGKVVVMNWEALDGSPYAGVFKDFQTETGKTIEYQFSASGSDYWPKTRTVLGSNNPPDLMRIDDDFVAYYASTGKLLDLREFIAGSGLNEADYFPTVFNNTKQPDGSIVGWSLGIQPRVIFYNKTMFAEAGVPLPPTTWTDDGWTFDDFIDAARKLSVAGKRWGASIIDDSGYEMIYPVNNGGTGRWSADGTRFALADPADAEAVQWVADLTCKYDAQPTWSELQQSGRGAELFAAGQIGMIQRVSGFVNYFRENVKDFEWDIAPVPGKAKQQTYGNQIVFAIPSAAANKEGAWELLRYLTGATGAETFARQGSFIPGLRAAAGTAAKGDGKAPEHLGLILDAADHAVLPGRIVEAEQALQIYRPALDPVRNCQGQAPEILTGLRPQIEAIIQQGG
jgi:ABC-type glycerol-3-phosphate transport system substrate-binding protein